MPIIEKIALRRLRVPLTQPLTFCDGSMWLQPGYTPQPDTTTLERYRVATYTAS